MKKTSIFIILLCVAVLSSKGNTGNDFELILPDIYKLQGACNVYLLKSGTSGLLIDAGSGSLPPALEKVGIEKVDWILHTHYHRDQCTGSVRLKNSGTKIAIGKTDKDYLQVTDNQTTDNQTTGNQNPISEKNRYLLNGDLSDYGRRMEPFQKPGVDRELSEGDIFDWNQFHIRTIETPGHTKGSVSYLVEVDGQSICFSGDLILRGGYVRDLYSMQWIYLQNPGINSSLSSIDKISKLNPKLLLPSHGATIDLPQEDLRMLKLRLARLKESLSTVRAGRWNWSNFIQVSDHVIQDCGSTSQLIIAESGEALLYDCGKEFTPERLAEAKQKFGITRVAVIIPSHWHYDHIDGIPAMAKSEGAEIWAWEKLKEHVEHPENFLATCWTNTSFKVDRVLSEGESFEWGGYSFGVHHNPVHMEEQMGLSAMVDGIKFYLIADGSSLSREGYMRSSIHCYNGISIHTALNKTAQSFYKADPYICLPAHSNVFALHNDARSEFREWALKTTENIITVLPPGRSEIGFNPYWASFYPATLSIKPGGEAEIFLQIANRENHSVSGKIRLKSSEEIVFRNETIDFDLEPGENGTLPVFIKAKKTGRPGTHIITADMEFDNEFFGELPQGYIQIDE